MPELVNRFESYSNALPGARAAQDLNALGDAQFAPVKQPCLTRLPLDAGALNKALGINPASPNAIKPTDLRNDATGYRSAIYRSEMDGKLIVVSRDTQPPSLQDWKTNIFNGKGGDTAQYRSARTLATKLNASGKSFDIAGYSKGGGLAQEMGLVSPNSKVYVFNSAGLHSNSLSRTGQANFNSLVERTSAFSSEHDFMTFMNNATQQDQQIENANFLRDHLAGNASGLNPMKIKYASPANTNPRDPNFVLSRAQFLTQVDEMIAEKLANPSSAPLFPPVRAYTAAVVPNSLSFAGSLTGARSEGPSLGKLAQHQLSNIVGPNEEKPGPMEKQIAADRNSLKDFLKSCG